MVGKRDRGAPHQLQMSGVELETNRTIAQHIRRGQRDRCHLLAVVDEMVERTPQVVAVAGAGHNRFNRIGLPAVPIDVEYVAESRHDTAHDQYVHVDKIVRRVAGEIFVGDVAPAHDRDHAVRDE